VPAYFNTRPVRITPTAVTLEDSNGQRFDVATDFVLLMTGYIADMTLFENAGVNLSANRGAPEFNEKTMETNIAGLYVAGTAVAGTQERYAVFIENCHIHVQRILAALTEQSPPQAGEIFQQPES
jgi:thioredoxin reductase (NADPH)